MRSSSADDMSRQSQRNPSKTMGGKQVRKVAKAEADDHKDDLLYSRSGFSRVVQKAVAHEEWYSNRRESFDTGRVESSSVLGGSASPCAVVKIFGVTGLAADEWLWTPNSFCTVALDTNGRDYQSTHIATNTRDPEWNSTLVMPIQTGANLIFKVFDDDTRSRRFLGEATVDSAQLLLGFAGEVKLLSPPPASGEPAFLFINIRCCEGLEDEMLFLEVVFQIRE